MSVKQPVIVSTAVPSLKVVESAFAGAERIHPLQVSAFAEKVNGCQYPVQGLALGNGSCTKATGFAVERDGNERFTEDMLNPSSIKCLVMCKIDGSSSLQLNDKFFTDRLEAMSEACPQYSDAPIQSAVRMPDNSDNTYWGHELGENGYVGVATEAQIPGAPHLGGEGYYIVASVGVPLLGQDLIAAFAKEGLTWSQVQADKRMVYWKKAAETNAKRVAYAAAEAIGVKIQTDIENPSKTYRQDISSEAPRRTADPEIVQMVSSVIDGVQYDHCAPVSSFQSSNAFSSSGKEKQRVAVVSVSPFVHKTVVLPVSTVNSNVVPTVTGRSANVYSDTAFVSKSNSRLAAHISNAFTWEGATETNDRLNPAAYRQFDGPFFASHFTPSPSLMAASSSGQALVPVTEAYNTVAMKIASRAIQRQSQQQ
jgi:hypothetical protein